MHFLVLLTVLLVHSVLTRHVLYNDLDEDEQQLLEAVYDTPSYNQMSYEEGDNIPLDKLDLVKDGLWAVKAKIKQLKAFNKALTANLLATKLKLKELLENQMQPIKRHKDGVQKKRPFYNYQQPPSYPQYDQQYVAPNYEVHQYGHDPYHGM